jgi:hypothetical protein
VVGTLDEPDRRSLGWRELLALTTVGAVAMTVGVLIGIVATRDDGDTVRARADDATATESVRQEQLDDAEQRTADAEEALEEAEDRVAELEADLAARSSTTVSDAQLAAIRDEVEGELADRSTALDEREVELDARAVELEELATALDEREADVEEREVALRDRDEEQGDDDSTATSIPRSSFGDGVHRVGIDIRAGTYRGNTQGDTCYWARLSALDGGTSSIIASDIVEEGTVTLTIPATDAGFESTGCGIWTRVG